MDREDDAVDILVLSFMEKSVPFWGGGMGGGGRWK